MKRYRVAIITNEGDSLGKNFKSKGEAEEYLLEVMESGKAKHYRILDRETNKMIERS